MPTFESEQMTIFISFIRMNEDNTAQTTSNCSLDAQAITSIDDLSVLSVRIEKQLFDGTGKVCILGWQHFDAAPAQADPLTATTSTALPQKPPASKSGKKTPAPLIHPEPGHIPMPK